MYNIDQLTMGLDGEDTDQTSPLFVVRAHAFIGV